VRRIWFGLVVCLAGAMEVRAQIRQLATTDDGSELYFSSTLRLKGSGEYINSKIFEITQGNYQLIAQIAPSALGDLYLPGVSGDGTILTYDQICTASCTNPAPRGFVIGAQLPPVMTASGSLRVSHNGRYLLNSCCLGNAVAAPAEFYDAQTGIVTQIHGLRAIDDGRHSIADDGTLLLTTGAGFAKWYLYNSGNYTLLPIQPDIVTGSASLSADGSVMVYQSSVNRNGSGNYGAAALYTYNVKTSASAMLATGPQALTIVPMCGCPIVLGPWFLPSISNDGSRVLFQDADTVTGQVQVFVSNADGTDLVELTNEPQGIAESTISGDGQVAYATTATGDLLFINAVTGDIQRLLGDLPSFEDIAPVAGSRTIVKGTRLATPDGQSLVSFAEFQAPVISVSSTSVVLQVPWEGNLEPDGDADRLGGRESVRTCSRLQCRTSRAADPGRLARRFPRHADTQGSGSRGRTAGGAGDGNRSGEPHGGDRRGCSRCSVELCATSGHLLVGFLFRRGCGDGAVRRARAGTGGAIPDQCVGATDGAVVGSPISLSQLRGWRADECFSGVCRRVAIAAITMVQTASA
jgi:hypothetical protein